MRDGKPAPPGPPLAKGTARAAGLVFFLALDLLALGILPLPERLTAALRSAVAPGLGLLVDEPTLAAVLLVAAFITTIAWIRWGVSLPAIAVWWAGIVLTVRLFPGHTHGPAAALPQAHAVRAAHEFTWVMAVYVVVYWFGLLVRRVPGVERLLAWRRRFVPEGERALLHLGAVDGPRAVALWCVARRFGTATVDPRLLEETLARPATLRRACIIRLLAHGRWRGDPFAEDNAGWRAARILLDQQGGSSPTAEAASRAAAASRLGMPATEPGWVRLFEGTLLAAALHEAGDQSGGERWRFALARWFRLQRGHRPEARQELLGISRGRAPDWEHATAMAIAAAHGWCEPGPEWQALRRRVFAAIGRGGRTPADNRLVATGRCWAALLDDAEARRLLQRVSSSPRDPVALALDALAAAFERQRADDARLASVTPLAHNGAATAG